MNEDLFAKLPRRYSSLDIHKYYSVATGVNFDRQESLFIHYLLSGRNTLLHRRFAMCQHVKAARAVAAGIVNEIGNEISA